MTFCAGVSESSTSASRQRSFVFLMKDLTTLKLTSASRSAMRISFMAELMSSSLSFPFERRPEKMDCSLSERLSSIAQFSNQSVRKIERIEIL